MTCSGCRNICCFANAGRTLLVDNVAGKADTLILGASQHYKTNQKCGNSSRDKELSKHLFSFLGFLA